MIRHLGAVLGAATLVGALAAAPAGAAPAVPSADPAASAAVDPSAGLPAGQRAALRRDLGLTDEQLRVRSVVEAAAPSTERRLRAELGVAYGGSWIAGDGSTLVVGVTTAADATRVRRTGAQPQVVRRSLAELDRARATLDRAAGRAGPAVHSWYVDPASNSVVIQAADTAAAQAFAQATGTADAARPVVAAAERPARSTTSAAATSTSSTATRSARSASPVAGGFVTAGHCGGAGSPTAGSNGVAQGTFAGLVVPRQRLRLGAHQRPLDAAARG